MIQKRSNTRVEKIKSIYTDRYNKVTDISKTIKELKKTQFLFSFFSHISINKPFFKKDKWLEDLGDTQINFIGGIFQKG